MLELGKHISCSMGVKANILSSQANPFRLGRRNLAFNYALRQTQKRSHDETTQRNHAVKRSCSKRSFKIISETLNNHVWLLVL